MLRPSCVAVASNGKSLEASVCAQWLRCEWRFVDGVEKRCLRWSSRCLFATADGSGRPGGYRQAGLTLPRFEVNDPRFISKHSQQRAILKITA